MAQNFLKINNGVNFKGQASAPSSPDNGDEYYDSTRNTLVSRINGNWTDLQSRSDVASGASLTSANFTASVVQSTFVRVTGSTSGSIHGLTASSAAKRIILYNQSSVLQTLKNQSATESTAANRIVTPTGADMALTSGQSATLTYDDSQSRWVVVSVISSGGGSGGTKNYLSAITTSQSSTPNSGNGNFELGSAAGWDWANVGTLTNGLPTGTPNFTTVNSNALYAFTITTSSTCAVGDTYTNNTQTFTVVTALSAQSGTVFFATGTGDPTATGNLTRATGSGTATIAYTAFSKETLSTVSSGQLAGSYSLSMATSGATVAGLGFCSDAFNIDTEDQAKVLTWKFYYQAQTNPANANWSGTSSNSFGVAVYDVTNAAWLATTGAFGLTQNSGIGYVTGTVQTATTTTQMRIVVYNVSATSGAVTLYFDDFTFGPQTAPIGPALTDWQSFTPTGSWTTNTTYTGRWRRVGDNAEIEYNLALAGAPNSAILQINIPGSIGTIDTTKLIASTNNQELDGHGEIISNSTRYPTVPLFVSSSVLQVQYRSITTFTGTAPVQQNFAVTQAAPFTFASGNSILMRIRVPISGWSSSTSMSQDTDTRVVAFSTKMNSGTQTATGNFQDVTWNAASVDTHGGFNGTTTYTAPVTGNYLVSATVLFTPNATGNRSLLAMKNGAIWTTGSSTPGGATDTQGGTYSDIIPCNAGDTIKIQAFQSSGGNLTYLTSNNSSFSVMRISGPAIVSATESVNARYFSSSTAISGSDATITYATKDFDSHSAYSSGTYTIPVSGKYSILGKIVITDVSGAHTTAISIYKNGSQVSSNVTTGIAAGTNADALVADILSCLAGDTITIRANDSGTTPSISASNTRNYFSIARVGN